jgi:hypothetical protein
VDGNGVAQYTPAYFSSKFARIFEYDFGMQGMLRELKKSLYRVPGTCIINYDIVASHPSFILEFFKHYDVLDENDDVLIAYVQGNLKHTYAEQAQLPVDVWKELFNSLWCGGCYGNHPYQSAVFKTLVEYCSNYHSEKRPNDLFKDFREVAGPFIAVANKWLQLLQDKIIPELTRVDSFTKEPRSRVEDAMSYVENRTQDIFVLPGEINSGDLSEIAAFFLQGWESEFIFNVMILADQHGLHVLSNEHDGLVIQAPDETGITLETIEKARELSELHPHETFIKLDKDIFSKVSK